MRIPGSVIVDRKAFPNIHATMLQGDSAPARNSKLAAVLTKALIVFVVTIAVGAAIFFTVSAVLHDRFMQRLEDESHEDFKDHLRLIKENQ